MASSWLVFDGLDTFVDILLCNTNVGNTANQFRQYYFDVSSILQSCKGKPALDLVFGPATNITLELAKTGPGNVFGGGYGGDNADCVT